jgi:hypothetical protein
MDRQLQQAAFAADGFGARIGKQHGDAFEAFVSGCKRFAPSVKGRATTLHYPLRTRRPAAVTLTMIGSAARVCASSRLSRRCTPGFCRICARYVPLPQPHRSGPRCRRPTSRRPPRAEADRRPMVRCSKVAASPVRVVRSIRSSDTPSCPKLHPVGAPSTPWAPLRQ